jgi:hypothetical protein
MPPESLTPVVRRALNRERAIADDWAYAPLTHGVINPVTAGLYRFSGMACDGKEQLPWSVILKAIHWVDFSGTHLADGYMDEPSDWNCWKREALVIEAASLAPSKPTLLSWACWE